MVSSSSEKCWNATTVLLIGGLVSIFLTLDVPYLLFMRKGIESSIDEKMLLLHMSTAGILVLLCIMYAIVAIFSKVTETASQSRKFNYPLLFLGLLVLLQFILSVVMFAKMSGGEKGKLKHNVEKYWQFKNDSPPQRYVDDIQVSLLCCGVTGVDDYGTMNIPPSCCENKGCDKERAFQAGCYGKVSTLLLTQAMLPILAAAMCLLITVVSLMGILRIKQNARSTGYNLLT